MQREVSRRVVEVGCERFFGVSGYVSQLRRAMLGVRTYERLAMLSHMLEHIYIDPKWVAKEYLRRNKAKAWKLQKDDDSLKCFNPEQGRMHQLMSPYRSIVMRLLICLLFTCCIINS